MITHLPGWQIGKAAGLPDGDIGPWMLTEEDARLAASKNVAVVTTSLPKLFLPDVEENRPLLASLHQHNLRLLAQHGVTILIGSDSQSDLVPAEILHIAAYGVFDNKTLLRMATMTTSRTIFPDRRVGCLEDGCEASFLVLEGDPLADLARLSEISVMFKEGELLNVG